MLHRNMNEDGRKFGYNRPLRLFFLISWKHAVTPHGGCKRIGELDSLTSRVRSGKNAAYVVSSDFATHQKERKTVPIKMMDWKRRTIAEQLHIVLETPRPSFPAKSVVSPIGP